MSPAISGSGGHDALWAAVIAMMWGFDLDTEMVRALIVEEFNPRCDPPWDERELWPRALQDPGAAVPVGHDAGRHQRLLQRRVYPARRVRGTAAGVARVIPLRA